MPNQSDPNQNKPATSTIPTVADLPPLPPEFQKVGSEPTVAMPPKISGSAGPTNEKVSTVSPATITPRKKFGGGRIIATILGILLLVGGITGGVILTQQQQDIRERAWVPVDIGDPANDPNNPGNLDDGEEPDGMEPGPAATPYNGPAQCATPEDCPTNNNGCAATQCSGSPRHCVYPSGVCTSIGCASDINCPSDRHCVAGSCQPTPPPPPISGCPDPGAVKCDANGCTVGSNFDGSTSNCAVYKYKCPNDWPGGVSCDESTGGTFVGAGVSATFSGCGTEQIDIYCPACGDSFQSGTTFVSKFNQGSCVTDGGTSPPGGTSAQCLNVKAYDSNWVVLSGAQLSALSPGDEVNFCVAGSKTGGQFSQAEFKIGAAAKVATTTLRPASNDFCQTYTIQATDTTISVKARIFHSTLGWIGEAI